MVVITTQSLAYSWKKKTELYVTQVDNLRRCKTTRRFQLNSHHEGPQEATINNGLGFMRVEKYTHAKQYRH